MTTSPDRPAACSRRYVALALDSGGYVTFDLYQGRQIGRVTERWSAAAWLAAKLNRKVESNV